MSAAAPRDRRGLIAIDLGAESCRVSLLRWITKGADAQPTITLVHRFSNAPVAASLGGEASLRWPLRRPGAGTGVEAGAGIEAGIDAGMRLCAAQAPEGIRSVAVDGWAVDYVRLDHAGQPLDEPFCYRDERTLVAEQRLHARLSAERMRAITGVQQLRINTLYQLYADRLAGLPAGSGWLNLPEYLLSRWGAPRVAEYTNATHTQLIDIATGSWSAEIFAAADLDLAQAPLLVPPGTRLKHMQGPLTTLDAFRETELIAPACHDTASALAGIPMLGRHAAYISSGTWSLVGTLLDSPINSAGAQADNFTNLGGVGGATCFHRNVNGMWLLRQCLKAWAAPQPNTADLQAVGPAEAGRLTRGAGWSLEELLLLAEQLPPPDALLAVDAPELLLPGRMPARINAERARAGLPALDESPANAPAFVALVLHSLAARYAQVLAEVQAHSGKELRQLYIVGGGSRNGMLNRLTAKATGLEVVCGPVESATIGNFAVQLAALASSSPRSSRAFAEEVARWAALLPVHSTA